MPAWSEPKTNFKPFCKRAVAGSKSSFWGVDMRRHYKLGNIRFIRIGVLVVASELCDLVSAEKRAPKNSKEYVIVTAKAFQHQYV